MQRLCEVKERGSLSDTKEWQKLINAYTKSLNESSPTEKFDQECADTLKYSLPHLRKEIDSGGFKSLSPQRQNDFIKRLVFLNEASKTNPRAEEELKTMKRILENLNIAKDEARLGDLEKTLNPSDWMVGYIRAMKEMRSKNHQSHPFFEQYSRPLAEVPQLIEKIPWFKNHQYHFRQRYNRRVDKAMEFLYKLYRTPRQ